MCSYWKWAKKIGVIGGLLVLGIFLWITIPIVLRKLRGNRRVKLGGDQAYKKKQKNKSKKKGKKEKYEEDDIENVWAPLMGFIWF